MTKVPIYYYKPLKQYSSRDTIPLKAMNWILVFTANTAAVSYRFNSLRAERPNS
jgi:hypothetical protein